MTARMMNMMTFLSLRELHFMPSFLSSNAIMNISTQKFTNEIRMKNMILSHRRKRVRQLRNRCTYA